MKLNALVRWLFHVIHIDDGLQSSTERSLSILLVNDLLRNNDVTVTLQWPREPGAVYRAIVLPEIHTAFTNAMSHNIITVHINLTISYDIKYNVSIVSSLCGVTRTKVLNYGKLMYMHMGIIVPDNG